MGPTIVMPAAVMQAMVDEVTHDLPFEGCGILIGREDAAAPRVTARMPATNIEPGDRTRGYQIDWRTLFDAVRRTREGDARILGFYHSHPDGSPRPSRRDAAEAWPSHVYLIVALAQDRTAAVTAWRRRESEPGFEELKVEVDKA